MSVWEKAVTERDFRMAEYKDAKPGDYEFGHDGKPVRKDRWVVGFGKIAALCGFGGRAGYDIDFIVERVKSAIKNAEEAEALHADWKEVALGTPLNFDDLVAGNILEVRLSDGSVLRGVECSGGIDQEGVLRWRGRPMYEDVVAYRNIMRL